MDDEEKQGARDATDLPSTPGGGGRGSYRIGLVRASIEALPPGAELLVQLKICAQTTRGKFHTQYTLRFGVCLSVRHAK